MTYTVKSGDSLSLIAQNILKDISRWPEIATLNNISNPALIYPGQVLTLPEVGSGSSKKPFIHPIEIGLLAALALAVGIVVVKNRKNINASKHVKA